MIRFLNWRCSGTVILLILVIKKLCCLIPLAANTTECDFEQTTLCGYSQDNTDNFDWTWNSGDTPSSLTGPSTDHTTGNSTGHYVYIESSAPRTNGEKARLTSPSYQLQVSG
ncbi:hypothetical protein DPMN_140086 [Dreissena polymorpha]|uniref:MAM domain-containing protein n=1 Tax=Dreissena polymorpha TaxID=45954 RepID=A0A9D4G6Y4_DREPO|nr:hypothetical protein DPMN_140086 [Dreissena polymorpha]